MFSVTKKHAHLLMFAGIGAILAMGTVALNDPRFMREFKWVQSASAQSSILGTLSGWAWSDNLGWISFSGSNYGVVVQADGTLAGYAWTNPQDEISGSNNIGWISFNAVDTASCGQVATLSGTSITGWAKVISADSNGWNGCVSLNGTSPSYGMSLPGGASVTGTAEGYLWSDDTIGGWISLNCDTGGPSGNNICGTSNYAVTYTTSYIPPSIAPLIFPAHVRSGTTATIKYTVTNPPATCTIVGTTATTTVYSTTVSPIDGVQGSISPIIFANTLFTMACAGISVQGTVGVIPLYQEQ
jgi:hypothetical protein